MLFIIFLEYVLQIIKIVIIYLLLEKTIVFLR